jgi:hypothetical protein
MITTTACLRGWISYIESISGMNGGDGRSVNFLDPVWTIGKEGISLLSASMRQIDAPVAALSCLRKGL